MGFPVITVQSQNEDGGSKTLTLTQEKFNADGSKSSSYLWCVPITIVTSKGKIGNLLGQHYLSALLILCNACPPIFSHVWPRLYPYM